VPLLLLPTGACYLTHLLSTNDNGRTVTVDAVETITLRLPENPTTGYRWAVASCGKLKPSDDAYQPDSALPGASGIRTFVWTAVPGVHPLALVLRREWEPADQALDHFSMNVQVISRT
jgi:predicted secreted protein